VMTMRSARGRFWVLAAVAAVCTAITFSALAPVAQDPAYHHFADTRWHNAWNVLSNLGFLIVGILGCRFFRRDLPYALFVIGTILTAFGSAWYHLAPSDATLVWDRLPMTISFAGFLGLVMEDRVGYAVRESTVALLALGIGSVVYWRLAGDLRWYGLMQGFAVVGTLVMLMIFPGRRAGKVWLALAAYVVAKLCEQYDRAIYDAIHVTGGHALKHIAAALAAGAIVWWAMDSSAAQRSQPSASVSSPLPSDERSSPTLATTT